MIDFCFDTGFEIDDTAILQKWIFGIIGSEGFEPGEISFIFSDDDHLHKLNLEFLGHDTLTDVISFDYSMGKQINGEIFISVERVRENSEIFKVPFEKELHRVMIHGILHYCGYKDKSLSEELVMREKEDAALSSLGFQYL